MDFNRLAEGMNNAAKTLSTASNVALTLGDTVSEIFDKFQEGLEEIAEVLNERSESEGTEATAGGSEEAGTDKETMYNYLLAYSPDVYGQEKVRGYLMVNPEVLEKNYRMAMRYGNLK